MEPRELDAFSLVRDLIRNLWAILIGALAVAIDHRKGHQRFILHFALQPVDGGFYAGRLITGKPGPVAVIAQGVGIEQIHSMLCRIQRLKTTKPPFQHATL